MYLKAIDVYPNGGEMVSTGMHGEDRRVSAVWAVGGRLKAYDAGPLGADAEEQRHFANWAARVPSQRSSAWQSPATPAVEAGIWGGTPRPSRKDFVAMGAVLVVTLFYWDSRSCHGRYFRVDAECSLG